MAWYIAGRIGSFLLVLIRLSLLAVLVGCALLMVIQVKNFNAEFKSFNSNLDKFNTNIPVLVYGVSNVHKSVESLTNTVNERHKELYPELASFNESFAMLNHYLPYLINESYSLRQELPSILTEIEKIVGQAEDVSKAASEGAVEGAMRGVLSLPAEVISSIITLPYEAVKKTGEKVKKNRVEEIESDPVVRREVRDDQVVETSTLNVDETNITSVDISDSAEKAEVREGLDEGELVKVTAEPEISTDNNPDKVQNESVELKVVEGTKKLSQSAIDKL